MSSGVACGCGLWLLWTVTTSRTRSIALPSFSSRPCRELEAVNAEHSKNLQNDARWLYQLQGSHSNPRHAFHKFGTGNLETLETSPRRANVNVCAALLDVYATYYSASLMNLVIYGKEPLATLRGWAEALFATIPTSGRTCPTFGNEVPWDASRLARVVQVHPVKDLRIIDLSWPLPSLHGDYLTKPTKILSHLIGHEGAGSILSPRVGQWPLEAEILAREILRLVKNPRVQGRRTLEHVDVFVHHFHDVIATLHACFRDVHFDTKEGPIFLISTECEEEPIQYASQLGTGMHRYAPKYMLTGSHLLYYFDEEKVQHGLNLLTAPRMRLTVVSKTFEGTTECVEKWYHTPNSEAPIASSLLERWASPPLNGALQLPH
ncbi:hypothetical protein PsorP6_011877 [Peronosclerospora sorghi]|uniref:Uncharacterized protein n=1 Tax=Peronosclerospora sorghi TaxID=230839 RepID=A0ACC0WKX5_9STRA|nr:hypothetical protein PsorP6_011877 [Peronosclerospora sorghi]